MPLDDARRDAHPPEASSHCTPRLPAMRFHDLLRKLQLAIQQSHDSSFLRRFLKDITTSIYNLPIWNSTVVFQPTHHGIRRNCCSRWLLGAMPVISLEGNSKASASKLSRAMAKLRTFERRPCRLPFYHSFSNKKTSSIWGGHHPR